MKPDSDITFSISAKITLSMLLVAIIPILASGVINHQTMIRQIRTQVEKELTGTLENLKTFTDGWVEMNRRMLSQNATLPDIRTMDANLQHPVLQSIVAKYPWVYLAFTVDRNGMNIGRSDDAAPKDYRDRLYVKQVLEGEPLGQQVLIGKTSGLPALVLAVPVRSETNDLLGVLAIAMKIGDISEKIVGAKIGRTGFAFLVDDAGKVIAHPSEAFAKVRENLSGHPAVRGFTTANKSMETYTGDNGVRKIAIGGHTASGWLIVVEQDHDEAFQAVRKANRFSMIILAVTLVLVPLVAFPVSRALTGPIRRLTSAADEISQGALDHPIVDTSRKDEIGALARAIERLGISVKYAMERLNRNR